MKTKMNIKKTFTPAKCIFLLASILVLAITEVNAQVFSFNNANGDHLWSNAENWLDGLKPSDENAVVTILADVIVDEDVTIQSLYDATPCNFILQEGKSMTVNATLVWDKGGDFILEDKAQLMHQEYAFQAKVLKKISAFDENHHLWNLIASPIQQDIVPSTENGFLTDPETGYALYSFNEENHTWINYKETPFVIANEQGYLYANAFDTTLVYDGYVRSAAVPAEVNLSYHATNNMLAGCNLVGNPFPCNAFVDRSYYTINESSNSLIAVALSSYTPITPCTGIIVKAVEADETVTFRHEILQSSEHQGYIEITAAKSNAQDLILDQALLSFNAGDDLGKFALYEGAPSVYFTKDNNDLAILSIDSIDMLPLKFKAAENGSYTIHFELKDLNLNYLHLIDNMTGSNIDLLSSHNYTFNASSSDYASRFKLVFDPHYGVEEHENNGFAYYANGEIIINNIETQSIASLQVCDLTGRVVFCRDAVRHVSTYGMSPGVYVLRLKTQNEVRTQKIIIE